MKPLHVLLQIATKHAGNRRLITFIELLVRGKDYKATVLDPSPRPAQTASGIATSLACTKIPSMGRVSNTTQHTQHNTHNTQAEFSSPGPLTNSLRMTCPRSHSGLLP